MEEFKLIPIWSLSLVGNISPSVDLKSLRITSPSKERRRHCQREVTMTIVKTMPKMGHIKRSKGNSSAGPSDESGAISVRLASDVGNGSVIIIKVVVITLLAVWWRRTCHDVCVSHWAVNPGVSWGGLVAVPTGKRGAVNVAVAC